MSCLKGKRILVVEDEPILAMCLEDMLRDLGCEVVGPALRLDAAVDLAKHAPLDAAVLDVNLGGGRSYAVADALVGRDIPYVFATGYGASAVEPGRPETPIVQKPYSDRDLEAALLSLFPSANGPSDAGAPP